MPGVKAALSSAVIFVVLAFWFSGIHKVDEGHVGLYWRGGALLDGVTEPGYHLKIPFITTTENVQVTLQTDLVKNIPCGTSGGVMIYFEKIEVVNQLRKEHVHATIKKYGTEYDKIWIFDKIHHEINQFCSKHTLQEVYIDEFDQLDEALQKALQDDCNKWDTGIDIINIRVTKPKIPEAIMQNYLAVSEENADLGVVVTAPTCGACGVVPAVLRWTAEMMQSSEEEIIHALATAGLFGNIAKTNASISGAEVGCQGEVGVACAMAAAAAAQLMGGSSAQIEHAAEMALEHHLGLNCCPVEGLVQIPCIDRNAHAATRAVDCAEFALSMNGDHLISYDEVVLAMKLSGLDMRSEYKETALGGIALTYNLEESIDREKKEIEAKHVKELEDKVSKLQEELKSNTPN